MNENERKEREKKKKSSGTLHTKQIFQPESGREPDRVFFPFEKWLKHFERSSGLHVFLVWQGKYCSNGAEKKRKMSKNITN